MNLDICVTAYCNLNWSQIVSKNDNVPIPSGLLVKAVK